MSDVPSGIAQLTFAVVWPGDVVGIVLGAAATAVGILLVVAWLPQPPPSGDAFHLLFPRARVLLPPQKARFTGATHRHGVRS